MDSKPLRLFLTDDEPHVRLYMRIILTGCNVDIVGEGCNGEEAVAGYSRLKPDLMLMDISMPHKTGMEALDEILGSHPEAKIVMLTSISDQQSIKDALIRGAKDYIRKDTPIDDIKTALEKIFAKITVNTVASV